MRPLVLGTAALALFCLALSMWVWRVASERERRARMERFVADQIAPADLGVALQRQHASRGAVLGPAGWSILVRRAGRSPDLRFHLQLAGVWLIVGLGGAWAGGVAGLLVALVLGAVGIVFWLWNLASRRQRRMVDQLPGMLDAVVRLVTIGNSVGAAFQTAAGQAEEPLAEVMGRVASLNRSGLELDQALANVANLYGVRELHLLAAILGLALRFGGRSDQVLERTAMFMRDLRQARQELVAMSAEVRLSAWILALLPLGVAGFIIVFNNALFMGMWHDETGRMMLAGALGLQVLGSLWLYRMAKSV